MIGNFKYQMPFAEVLNYVYSLCWEDFKVCGIWDINEEIRAKNEYGR